VALFWTHDDGHFRPNHIVKVILGGFN
jgi:hypothetical protein